MITAAAHSLRASLISNSVILGQIKVALGLRWAPASKRVLGLFASYEKHISLDVKLWLETMSWNLIGATQYKDDSLYLNMIRYVQVNSNYRRTLKYLSDPQVYVGDVLKFHIIILKAGTIRENNEAGYVQGLCGLSFLKRSSILCMVNRLKHMFCSRSFLI